METLESRLQKRMHVSLYALLFLTVLLGLSVLLEGCSDSCEVTNEYTYYEPVYTTIQEIRSSVALEEPRSIKGVGKIYFKDGFLFLNEPGKGVHLIDDRDPKNPVNKNFFKIPGNYDIAIKGNTLYADSYVDLVAFDITDINNIKEVDRLQGVFKNYSSFGRFGDVNCCIVTDWLEKKDVRVSKSECDANIQPWGGIFFEDGIAFASASSFDKSAAIAPGNGSGPGVGGSMARFTIAADSYLYILDGGDIQSISISSQAMDAKDRTYLNWDIETIFPYKKNLFIGSQSGMHILDITNPNTPVKLSTYEHVRSCDPVVVEDNYAYVTLRSGNQCRGFTNQLEVIDITDLKSPALKNVYPMFNPYGLGIDNKILFICDGDDGLKVYDAADINTIDKNQLAHYKNINAYDVIPFGNLLIMIGANGIFQYDYSNPKDIKLLSQINVDHD